mmetsp:Transcript_6007/g.10793  ORF Transcript_6007/g.10793 Transcript_6007/m.10793 type:complete len:281 (+) Transcript_6007:1205-2047(+)
MPHGQDFLTLSPTVSHLFGLITLALKISDATIQLCTPTIPLRLCDHLKLLDECPARADLLLSMQRAISLPLGDVFTLLLSILGAATISLEVRAKLQEPLEGRRTRCPRWVRWWCFCVHIMRLCHIQSTLSPGQSQQHLVLFELDVACSCNEAFSSVLAHEVGEELFALMLMEIHPLPLRISRLPASDVDTKQGGHEHDTLGMQRWCACEAPAVMAPKVLQRVLLRLEGISGQLMELVKHNATPPELLQQRELEFCVDGIFVITPCSTDTRRFEGIVCIAV